LWETFILQTASSIIRYSRLDEKNSKDTRKLNDIRTRHKIESTHDFQNKSKGRNIRSKQGHFPVYE
jgi:hypothetical protein